MRLLPLAWIAAGIGLSVGGCGGGRGDSLDSSAPPERARNVVLIVVDTLRPDRLGCHGGSPEVSPAFDSLAARGVRFTRAYSAAPWTLPSTASILTGLYPSSHGALNQRRRLPAEVTTLAEALRDRGWATAAVVSHVLVGSRFGFDQGYERFEEGHARGHDYVSTAGVAADAIAALDSLAVGESPFFLTVHFFDPHYTWVRREEIGRAPARAGRLGGGETIEAIRALDPPATEEEIAFLFALYDDEIRATDDGIAQLLAALDRHDVRDETLVVFTADHGEEFLEHGRWGHGRTLYEELVRVPLVAAGPGVAAGRVVDDPVSNVAVAATVLDLLGVAAPEIGRQAGSLVSLAADVEDAETDVLPLPLCEVDWDQNTRLRAMIGEREKIVVDRATQEASFYDLVDDPGETRSLVEERRDEAIAWYESLRDRNVALMAARREAVRESPLTAEQLEILRGLGYVE